MSWYFVFFVTNVFVKWETNHCVSHDRLSVHRLSVRRFSMFRMMIVRVLRKSYRIYVTSSAQNCCCQRRQFKIWKKEGTARGDWTYPTYVWAVGRPTLVALSLVSETMHAFEPLFSFLFFIFSFEKKNILNTKLLIRVNQRQHMGVGRPTLYVAWCIMTFSAFCFLFSFFSPRFRNISYQKVYWKPKYMTFVGLSVCRISY